MKKRMEKEKNRKFEVQEKLNYLKQQVEGLSPESSLKEVSSFPGRGYPVNQQPPWLYGLCRPRKW